MFKRLLSLTLIITFISSSLMPIQKAQANELNLPIPGSMINLSPAFEPTLIKGLTIHKDNPFLFDFIVDTGHSQMEGEALKSESDRLIKYFFACLTIPEKDLWVNLSPYEKDRMIPQALGETALGRDLLAQDYILKQLTASLIYPEKELGKSFWDKVYAQVQEKYGNVEVPVNTFNKVWILADKATVYEHNQTAFVVEGHLKVMLEEDYLALSKNANGAGPATAAPRPASLTLQADKGSASVSPASLVSNIVREIIVPEIENEVNSGKNFAMLRQIFNSQILATWYKKNLKEALLSQVYADKSTVKGVNLNDTTDKNKIYQQYLQAFKKGVFNFIKETDLAGQTVPRKYFSGGYFTSPAMLTTVKSLSPEKAAKTGRPTGTSFRKVSTAVGVNKPKGKAIIPGDGLTQAEFTSLGDAGDAAVANQSENQPQPSIESEDSVDGAMTAAPVKIGRDFMTGTEKERLEESKMVGLAGSVNVQVAGRNGFLAIDEVIPTIRHVVGAHYFYLKLHPEILPYDGYQKLFTIYVEGIDGELPVAQLRRKAYEVAIKAQLAESAKYLNVDPEILKYELKEAPKESPAMIVSLDEKSAKLRAAIYKQPGLAGNQTLKKAENAFKLALSNMFYIGTKRVGKTIVDFPNGVTAQYFRGNRKMIMSFGPWVLEGRLDNAVPAFYPRVASRNLYSINRDAVFSWKPAPVFPVMAAKPLKDISNVEAQSLSDAAEGNQPTGELTTSAPEAVVSDEADTQSTNSPAMTATQAVEKTNKLMLQLRGIIQNQNDQLAERRASYAGKTIPRRLLRAMKALQNEEDGVLRSAIRVLGNQELQSSNDAKLLRIQLKSWLSLAAESRIQVNKSRWMGIVDGFITRLAQSYPVSASSPSSAMIASVAIAKVNSVLLAEDYAHFLNWDRFIEGRDNLQEVVDSIEALIVDLRSAYDSDRVAKVIASLSSIISDIQVSSPAQIADILKEGRITKEEAERSGLNFRKLVVATSRNLPLPKLESFVESALTEAFNLQRAAFRQDAGVKRSSVIFSFIQSVDTKRRITAAYNATPEITVDVAVPGIRNRAQRKWSEVSKGVVAAIVSDIINGSMAMTALSDEINLEFKDELSFSVSKKGNANPFEYRFEIRAKAPKEGQEKIGMRALGPAPYPSHGRYARITSITLTLPESLKDTKGLKEALIAKMVMVINEDSRNSLTDTVRAGISRAVESRLAAIEARLKPAKAPAAPSPVAPIPAPAPTPVPVPVPASFPAWTKDTVVTWDNPKMFIPLSVQDKVLFNGTVQSGEKIAISSNEVGSRVSLLLNGQQIIWKFNPRLRIAVQGNLLYVIDDSKTANDRLRDYLRVFVIRGPKEISEIYGWGGERLLEADLPVATFSIVSNQPFDSQGNLKINRNMMAGNGERIILKDRLDRLAGIVFSKPNNPIDVVVRPRVGHLRFGENVPIQKDIWLTVDVWGNYWLSYRGGDDVARSIYLGHTNQYRPRLVNHLIARLGASEPFEGVMMAEAETFYASRGSALDLAMTAGDLLVLASSVPQIGDLLNWLQQNAKDVALVLSTGAAIVSSSWLAASTHDDDKPVGGIDLNAANMGMTITRDANGGVQVSFDQSLIERIRRDGVSSVVPVIINITPIADIRSLLF